MSTAKELMTARFNEVVRLAREWYPEFDRLVPGKIALRFDLRGQCAGRAYLGFDSGFAWVSLNLEAYDVDPNDMLNDTIAHEVAHIVAPCVFGKAGRGHAIGWRSVARALGSTGKRCHRLTLTKARRTRVFKYILPTGETVSFSAQRHRRVQAGVVYSMKRTGEIIYRGLPYSEVME